MCSLILVQTRDSLRRECGVLNIARAHCFLLFGLSVWYTQLHVALVPRFPNERGTPVK